MRQKINAKLLGSVQKKHTILNKAGEASRNDTPQPVSFAERKTTLGTDPATYEAVAVPSGIHKP